MNTRSPASLQVTAAASTIEPSAETILAQHADAIRALGKRVAGDIIEIGRRLTECRAIKKINSEWRTWLAGELKLSPQSAGRFIQLYELSDEHSNLEHLDVPVSALYVLAAPSNKDIRGGVIELAESGKVRTLKQVLEAVGDVRARKVKQEVEATDDPPERDEPEEEFRRDPVAAACSSMTRKAAARLTCIATSMGTMMDLDESDPAWPILRAEYGIEKISKFIRTLRAVCIGDYGGRP